MYKMTNEEKVIYDIANNIMNKDYSFNINNYDFLDWRLLLHKSIEQKIFPHVFNEVKNYLPQKEKIIYNTYIFKHKTNVDKAIKQSIKIINEFDRKNYKYVIVKGFILSNIIYGDPYMRQFSDIDIIVDRNHIIDACYCIENLGYKDRLITLAEKNLNIPDFNKKLYYSSKSEKKFFKKNDMLVEIKTCSHGYIMEIASIGIDNRCIHKINNNYFYSLNMQHFFMLLLENTFVNFYTDWGINNDYTIRDLIDFFCFIVKYKDIFHNDFLKTLEKNNYLTHLSMVINIIKNFFQKDSLKLIPDSLLQLSQQVDQKFYVEWKSELLERLFNRKIRINDYNRHLYNKIVYRDVSFPLESNDLSTPPYNYEKGLVETNNTLKSNCLIINLIPVPILYNVDYDKNNLFISLKISNKYPDLWFDFIFLKSNLKEYNSIEYKISIEFINKKISEVITEIDGIETYNNIVQDYNILTLKVPQIDEIKFVKKNNIEFFISLFVKFIGAKEQNSPNIARWGSNQWRQRISIPDLRS